MTEKKIIDLELPVSELKHDFGNPRKISRKKREELRESLDSLGNFGVIVIDEDFNIIAGNQRASVIAEDDPEAVVSCKQLIGYTESELRAINIKDNTHAGEWDLDLLAGWTADLTIDLGLEKQEENPKERKIKEMELIRYEKYDYVMIVCRSEIDYKSLIRTFGLEDAKVPIAKRHIKARAVWFDDIVDKLKMN